MELTDNSAVYYSPRINLLRGYCWIYLRLNEYFAIGDLDILPGKSWPIVCKHQCAEFRMCMGSRYAAFMTLSNDKRSVAFVIQFGISTQLQFSTNAVMKILELGYWLYCIWHCFVWLDQIIDGPINVGSICCRNQICTFCLICKAISNNLICTASAEQTCNLQSKKPQKCSIFSNIRLNIKHLSCIQYEATMPTIDPFAYHISQFGHIIPSELANEQWYTLFASQSLWPYDGR